MREAWRPDTPREPGSGDYTLAPESPAWLLGIQQIDFAAIGPR